jgi:uncharacterized MnhB-related membrane protein
VIYVLLALCAIYCAIQAIRTTRLLSSALWLAGLSALVSLILYLMGASQVAVIELSVGAGLVTVLFVFAINIANEEQLPAKPLVSLPLALALAAITLFLLGWMVLPFTGLSLPVSGAPFQAVFWEERAMDVLVQIVLIFAAVLGVLGLLSQIKLVARSEDEPAPHAYVEAQEEAQL